MQTDYVLFRNPQTPIQGTANGGTFAFPGSCLSANTCRMHISEFPPGRVVKYARWIITWTPQVLVAGPTSAVRLIMFDDGPSNIVTIAQISTQPNIVYATPRTDQVIITNELNAAIAAGVTKQFGHQTAGVGANGSLLYSSSIEVVWA